VRHGFGADFAGAAGPRPASEGGKLVLTTAPWRAPVAILEQRVPEHGDGNTRRIPLRTAVEGVPR